MVLDGLREGTEDDADLGELRLERRRDGHRVHHGVHGDAGERGLLTERDAQFLEVGQDLLRHVVDGIVLHLRAGRGEVVRVLVVDLGDLQVCPVGRLALFQELEKVPEGLEPVLEEPLGLLLLRRDVTHRVLGEPLGCLLAGDVRDEAVLVALLGDVLEEIVFCVRGHGGVLEWGGEPGVSDAVPPRRGEREAPVSLA